MKQQAAPSPDVLANAGHSTFADATYRKVALRFIPFLMLCYVVAYLDRVNIGIAKLNMRSDGIRGGQRVKQRSDSNRSAA